MASVLAGVTPPQRVDLAGDLMRGQQARQSVLAGQQQLQQGQMQLDRAPQVAAQQDQQHAMQMQRGQQQISESDFMQAVQRGRIINRLARQVREMPEGQRGQFVQSLDPEMLQSVGIDPAMIQDVGLDDQSLDAIIAQTEAALQESGADAPAGLRQFQGMAGAAGLQEGDEDYQRAARVQLGLEGRASGAGMQTFRMQDARGRERIFRFSPQDGSLQAYDGQSWVTAGPEEQQIAASGQAEMRPMEQEPQAQQQPPQQDTSELFVGRPREEEAQAVAERTPEPGTRFTPEGEMVPIPGSSAEREAEERRRMEQGRQATRQRAGQTVLRSVTRSLEEFLPEVAQGEGVIGSNLRRARSRVPGTAEYNLDRQVQDFSRNIGLDTLRDMREQSPTGGAVGQLPVQQQVMLQEVLGSFDITQPIEVLNENLNQLNNIYLDIIHGSSTERASAVERGDITHEQNAEVERMYRDVSFDEFGRRRQGEEEMSIDDLLRRYGN